MYVIQWKGRPCHWVGTNITRILYHAARAVSTVSCRFSLLVEDTALSISKTDAYFSITSARKVANALHLLSKIYWYFSRSLCTDFLPPSSGVFRLSLAGSWPGIPCRRSFGSQGSMKACRKHITMKQKFLGSIPSGFCLQNRK